MKFRVRFTLGVLGIVRVWVGVMGLVVRGREERDLDSDAAGAIAEQAKKAAAVLVRFPDMPDMPERVPTLRERRHDGPWGVPRGGITWNPREKDVVEAFEPEAQDPARGDR